MCGVGRRRKGTPGLGELCLFKRMALDLRVRAEKTG